MKYYRILVMEITSRQDLLSLATCNENSLTSSACLFNSFCGSFYKHMVQQLLKRLFFTFMGSTCVTRSYNIHLKFLLLHIILSFMFVFFSSSFIVILINVDALLKYFSSPPSFLSFSKYCAFFYYYYSPSSQFLSLSVLFFSLADLYRSMIVNHNS